MAIVMSDEHPRAGQIGNLLIELADDPGKLQTMKENCAGFIKNKAEDIIVSYLIREPS